MKKLANAVHIKMLQERASQTTLRQVTVYISAKNKKEFVDELCYSINAHSKLNLSTVAHIENLFNSYRPGLSFRIFNGIEVDGDRDFLRYNSVEPSTIFTDAVIPIECRKRYAFNACSIGFIAGLVALSLSILFL